MPESTLENDIREYRRLAELWRDHVAQVEIEIYGTVPEAVFGAYARKESIERNRELWENLCAVSTEVDVARAMLDVRMVEAHEWLKMFQEQSYKS